MPTEFPRDAQPKESTDDRASDALATSSDLTEDDVALIDLRYDQFIAQAELDQVMFEI